MSDSIVIIPTYNEKENIEKIIRAVFGLEKQFDILVIDDGSPDGTAAIVKGLMANEFAGGCLLYGKKSQRAVADDGHAVGLEVFEREAEVISWASNGH